MPTLRIIDTVNFQDHRNTQCQSVEWVYSRQNDTDYMEMWEHKTSN